MSPITHYMNITSSIIRVAESIPCESPRFGYWAPTPAEADASDAVARALAFKGLSSVDNPHPVEPSEQAPIRGNPEQFVTGAGVRK